MKLASKIFLLCGFILLAFSLMTGWVYLQLRNNLYQGKNALVESAVNATWGIVDYYVTQVEKGVLTAEEAKERAKEAVRHTRFEGSNYFWIQDTEPSMIMHPIKPELDGSELAEILDPTGKAFFMEMAELAKSESQGFINYQFSKPGSSKPVPKVSFIKLVPEWNWIVGAGLYLDDIQAELIKVSAWTIGVGLAVIALSILLIVLVVRNISWPMKRAVAMIRELEAGRLDRRLNMQRRDEIGQMAQTMDAFADSLQYEVVDALQKLAAGDLSFQVTPKDEKDMVRGALQKLGEDLNDLLSQVQTAGEQIASGSS